MLVLLLAGIRMSADDLSGFTFAAAKSGEESGTVLVAHNEDTMGKNRRVDIRKFPETLYKPGEVLTLTNQGTAPRGGRAFGFLRLKVSDSEFTASYVTEPGVVIVSNSCISREDRPKLTNGGIGVRLRRLMAERAATAREAVQIAGQLIETFGYFHSGRSYAVADAREVWVLQVVRGKHWVARRVPDGHAAVTANSYTIGAVNLEDKKNFLASPDLISYAVKRGWYLPERDGAFHFARAYAHPDNLKHRDNVLRLWRGINVISKKRYRIDHPFPFAFVPKREVKTGDLFRLLRDHYEDTVEDLSRDYKQGSPNFTRNRAICNGDTRYSLVAVLRGKDKAPPELAPLIWIALGRPDGNAFSPWYPSIPAAPDGYSRHTSQPEYAYPTFAELARLIDDKYKSRIKAARKVWSSFENYTAKRLKKTEKEFAYLLEIHKHVAMKIITNHVHKLEYRKWFQAAQLIRQWTAAPVD